MPDRIVKKKWFAWLLLAITAGMFVGSAISLSLAVRADRNSRREVCRAVDNIDTVIQQQLRRSLMNLPRIQYYREHPAELRQQIVQVQREIDAFNPQACN